MTKSDKKKPRYYIGVVLVTLFALLCVIPLIYMICVSFAQTSTMYIKFDDIDFTDFSNYVYLFVNKNFGRPLLNSLIVVVASVILVDIVSCTMAYGFEKKPIPGKKPLFNMVLATMMIPTQVVFISLYVMIRKANLMNSYVALVIPLIGAFGVFMMRQFIRGVPNDFIEAAQIDGCSGAAHLFPGGAAHGEASAHHACGLHLQFQAWEHVLWPLIATTKNEMQTLTLATSSLTSHLATNYGYPMAAATISFLVPFILYCFMQKQFVEGIALGGVKG